VSGEALAYYDPDDPWCKCGRKQSCHATPENICKTFDRSWGFNGGKVKKVRTGRGKDAYAIEADRS